MFQSLWGFHPCDYQTYRKLKLLNHVYLQAVRMAHAWRRWHRKDPHNRVIRRRIRNEKGQTVGYEPPVPLAEPKLCPVFTRKVSELQHTNNKGQFSREGFMVEKVVTDDLGIPTDYASAKKPVADTSQVRALRLSVAELDDLLGKAQSWMEAQDVK